MEINRNMGCIEIIFPQLSVTHRTQINRNMGCIEINEYRRAVYVQPKINRNMGCIEIRYIVSWPESYPGLIETWDVLKFI